MTADAGVRLNADSELRAGYLFGRVDVERGIGALILPEFGGLERRTHILLRHDSQTGPFAPTRACWRPSSTGTGIATRFGTGGFSQLDGRASLFYAVAQRGPCVRAVRRRDVVWHRGAHSLQVFARRAVPVCPATRTMSFAGTTIFWRGRLPARSRSAPGPHRRADRMRRCSRCGIGLRQVGCGTGTRQPWRRTRPGHADRSGVGADCVQQGRRIAILLSDGSYRSNSMKRRASTSAVARSRGG